MNHGRTIFFVFVLIGALASVFALVLPENVKAAPTVSLSVSPISVTSATTPIDFSWSASEPSGWCCYYYYQTYNYSNGALSPWNYLGTITSSRNTLADFGYTQYGTYGFRIGAYSWTGQWNSGYSEWKNVSFLPPPPSNVNLRIDPPPAVVTLGENTTFSWSATNANEYWLFNNTTGTWEFLGNAAGSFTRSSAGSPIGQHWFYAGAYNRPNPTWISTSWVGLGILGHTFTKETINSSQPCGYQPSAASGFQLGERVYMFTSYPGNQGTQTFQHRYFRPDGTKEKDTSITGNYCYFYSSVDLTNSSHLGTWRVEMLIDGRSSASQTFSVTMPAPSAPTNFQFSPSSGIQGYITTASWSASSYAERYEYYAPALGVGSWTSIGNVTSIPLNTSTFSPNTYTVSLRACNSSGCSGSANASFTVQQPAPVAPSASISPTTITTLQSAAFSWGSASNASACTVFINGVDRGVASCSGGSQTFLGSNLGIGTHTAYVRACNDTTCANSNTVTLTVTTAAPAAPTNFQFNPISGIQGYTATASWSASSGTEHYEYYAPSLGITDWLNLGNRATTVFDTAALSPSVYTVWLRACNAAGCSGQTGAGFILDAFNPFSFQTAALDYSTIDPLASSPQDRTNLRWNVAVYNPATIINVQYSCVSGVRLIFDGKELRCATNLLLPAAGSVEIRGTSDAATTRVTKITIRALNAEKKETRSIFLTIKAGHRFLPFLKQQILSNSELLGSNRLPVRVFFPQQKTTLSTMSNQVFVWEHVGANYYILILQKDGGGILLSKRISRKDFQVTDRGEVVYILPAHEAENTFRTLRAGDSLIIRVEAENTSFVAKLLENIFKQVGITSVLYRPSFSPTADTNPYINVQGPSVGTIWTTNAVQRIQWSTRNIPENALLEVSLLYDQEGSITTRFRPRAGDMLITISAEDPATIHLIGTLQYRAPYISDWNNFRIRLRYTNSVNQRVDGFSSPFSIVNPNITLCTNECSSSDTLCTDPSTAFGHSAQSFCGNYDNDPCLEYPTLYSAFLGGFVPGEGIEECREGCSGNRCAVPTACQDQCTAGQTRCSFGGQALQQCGNYDVDSCLEFPESSTGTGNLQCEFLCNITAEPSRCREPEPELIIFYPRVSTVWDLNSTQTPQIYFTTRDLSISSVPYIYLREGRNSIALRDHVTPHTNYYELAGTQVIGNINSFVQTIGEGSDFFIEINYYDERTSQNIIARSSLFSIRAIEQATETASVVIETSSGPILDTETTESFSPPPMTSVAITSPARGTRWSFGPENKKIIEWETIGIAESELMSIFLEKNDVWRPIVLATPNVGKFWFQESFFQELVGNGKVFQPGGGFVVHISHRGSNIWYSSDQFFAEAEPFVLPSYINTGFPTGGEFFSTSVQLPVVWEGENLPGERHYTIALRKGGNNIVTGGVWARMDEVAWNILSLDNGLLRIFNVEEGRGFSVRVTDDETGVFAESASFSFFPP